VHEAPQEKGTNQFYNLNRFSSSYSLINHNNTTITMTDIFAPAPEPPTELGRYRILSSTAGVRVSPLCLGAMSIGEAWKEFMGSMDKEASFKLLDAFYDAGGNFIDTANNYQNEVCYSRLNDLESCGNLLDHGHLTT
jgi:Aldo/keto reductase family